MRFRFPWLALAAVVTVLLSARASMAQQWLSDRARAEGRGIRLGDFELHPGIGTEFGWVSNVYLADQNELSSPVLHVAPHLYLSTLQNREGSSPNQPVALRAGVSGVLREYFASGAPPIDMSAAQDARLTLKPSKIFQAEFFDEYHRSVDPFVEAFRPLSGVGTKDFGRQQLSVGTRMQLATPGQLLRAAIGYRFDIDQFESESFRTNRNHAHNITADSSWEFLPKTALVWNGTVRFRDWAHPSTNPNEPLHSNDVDVSSLIGINGALTPRVSATAAVGYAAGFYKLGADYEDVIVQAEARWTIRDGVLWAVGYDRQISPSFQGNFARANRIRTRLQALLVGALVVALKAELTFVKFGEDAAFDLGQGARKDTHLFLNLSGEYRFVDWLALTGEVGWIQDFTDYKVLAIQPVTSTNGTATATAMGNNDPARYKQFLAFIGLRAFL